jgi:hypothetical protein
MMNRTQATASLAISLALTASVALADEIKTISGKEYKNATVQRVEPDGLMVKFSGGLIKIPFTELAQELKEKYHYNPEEAQRFGAETAATISAFNSASHVTAPTNKQEEGRLGSISIFAIIKPISYGRDYTSATIQEYAQYWQGPTAYDFNWKKVGESFTGVIDERMPENYERGSMAVLTLYRIGHTNDSTRAPLFTTSEEKAMNFLTGEPQPQPQLAAATQPADMKPDCTVTATEYFHRLARTSAWANILSFGIIEDGHQLQTGHSMAVWKITNDGNVLAIDNNGTITLDTTRTEADVIAEELGKYFSAKSGKSVKLVKSYFEVQKHY